MEEEEEDVRGLGGHRGVIEGERTGRSLKESLHQLCY